MRVKSAKSDAMRATSKPPEPDRRGSVLSLSKKGFHRIAYVEWGNIRAKRVAICLHGLSRQGRDFDMLAMALAAQGFRVICPDLVGRGHSDWLRDPEEYNLPQYATDMTVLIARLGITEVDWIGTSLGGLVGMVLAGQSNSPIKRLVLNDIGPFLGWQALNRLAISVRDSPTSFPSLEAATEYLAMRLANFGHLTPEQWRHMAIHTVVEMPNGTWRRLSDPNIIGAFRPGWYFNLRLWNYWDEITCPTLVLRGATSDVLTPDTVEEMAKRGPRAPCIEFPDCGHAPALFNPAQIDPIVAWLDQAMAAVAA